MYNNYNIYIQCNHNIYYNIIIYLQKKKLSLLYKNNTIQITQQIHLTDFINIIG